MKQPSGSVFKYCLRSGSAGRESVFVTMTLILSKMAVSSCKVLFIVMA